jgi:hypothetical protein
MGWWFQHRDKGKSNAKFFEDEFATDCEYANEWRARCRAYNAAQAAKPKVKPGDTVTFAEPITFTNGDAIRTFTFQKRQTFTADGRSYNLGRDWKQRDYVVAA